MNKAIFIDLDGTLNPEGKKNYVSIENEKVLKKAQREGWMVVISTGRSLEDARNVWNKIKYNNQADYIIHSGGARVENLFTEEIFKNETIDSKIIEKYCGKLINKNCFIKFTHEDALYGKKNTFKAKILSKIFKISFKDYKEITYDVEPNKIGFILGLSRKKVVKFWEQMRKEFPELFIVITGSRLYVEATAKGVDKGVAIIKLSEIADIDLKKSIGIGDSMNDIEMLKVVGIPIAMKNAMKELKEVAKYETDYAHKNGVAIAVKKFTNKNKT